MKKLSQEWLESSVSHPYEDRYIFVDQCRIHYQYWGNGDKPGLLFIHGFSAHSHWWDMIAPHFLCDYDVAAIDISGFGESDWRDSYDISTHGKEISSVIADAKFENPLIVVHSMSTAIVINALGKYISYDSPVIFIDPVAFLGGSKEGQEIVDQSREKKRQIKYSETKEELVRKFRFFDGDELIQSHVRNYIAEHSIKQTNLGWTLKFDPGYIQKRDDVLTGRSLTDKPGLRAAIFGAESNYGTKEHQKRFKKLLGGGAITIPIGGSDHNVMLDSPLELIHAIKQILNDWAEIPEVQL